MWSIIKFLYSNEPLVLFLACGVDRLPTKMTAACKRVFTCAKLARQRKCAWSFKRALNNNCKRTLTRWQQNGLVKNSCRRSCRNCAGTLLWLENIINFFQYYVLISFYETDQHELLFSFRKNCTQNCKTCRKEYYWRTKRKNVNLTAMDFILQCKSMS